MESNCGKKYSKTFTIFPSFFICEPCEVRLSQVEKQTRKGTENTHTRGTLKSPYLLLRTSKKKTSRCASIQIVTSPFKFSQIYMRLF